MSFVGAVNVLPNHLPLAAGLSQQGEQILIRPHDLEVHPLPQEKSCRQCCAG
jgi:hypothetical protein